MLSITLTDEGPRAAWKQEGDPRTELEIDTDSETDRLDWEHQGLGARHPHIS